MRCPLSLWMDFCMFGGEGSQTLPVYNKWSRGAVHGPFLVDVKKKILFFIFIKKIFSLFFF